MKGRRQILGTRDLNPNFHFQRVACCRYTSPHWSATIIGPHSVWTVCEHMFVSHVGIAVAR